MFEISSFIQYTDDFSTDIYQKLENLFGIPKALSIIKSNFYNQKLEKIKEMSKNVHSVFSCKGFDSDCWKGLMSHFPVNSAEEKNKFDLDILLALVFDEINTLKEVKYVDASLKEEEEKKRNHICEERLLTYFEDYKKLNQNSNCLLVIVLLQQLFGNSACSSKVKLISSLITDVLNGSGDFTLSRFLIPTLQWLNVVCVDFHVNNYVYSIITREILGSNLCPSLRKVLEKGDIVLSYLVSRPLLRLYVLEPEKTRFIERFLDVLLIRRKLGNNFGSVKFDAVQALLYVDSVCSLKDLDRLVKGKYLGDIMQLIDDFDPVNDFNPSHPIETDFIESCVCALIIFSLTIRSLNLSYFSDSLSEFKHLKNLDVSQCKSDTVKGMFIAIFLLCVQPYKNLDEEALKIILRSIVSFIKYCSNGPCCSFDYSPSLVLCMLVIEVLALCYKNNKNILDSFLVNYNIDEIAYPVLVQGSELVNANFDLLFDGLEQKKQKNDSFWKTWKSKHSKNKNLPNNDWDSEWWEDLNQCGTVKYFYCISTNKFKQITFSSKKAEKVQKEEQLNLIKTKDDFVDILDMLPFNDNVKDADIIEKCLDRLVTIALNLFRDQNKEKRKEYINKMDEAAGYSKLHILFKNYKKSNSKERIAIILAQFYHGIPIPQENELIVKNLETSLLKETKENKKPKIIIILKSLISISLNKSNSRILIENGIINAVFPLIIYDVSDVREHGLHLLRNISVTVSNKREFINKNNLFSNLLNCLHNLSPMSTDPIPAENYRPIIHVCDIIEYFIQDNPEGLDELNKITLITYLLYTLRSVISVDISKQSKPTQSDIAVEKRICDVIYRCTVFTYEQVIPLISNGIIHLLLDILETHVNRIKNDKKGADQIVIEKISRTLNRLIFLEFKNERKKHKISDIFKSGKYMDRMFQLFEFFNNRSEKSEKETITLHWISISTCCLLKSQEITESYKCVIEYVKDLSSFKSKPESGFSFALIAQEVLENMVLN
jgi:hypothetical protein